MRSRVVVTALSLLVVGAFSVVFILQKGTQRYDSEVTGQLLISGGPAPGTPRPSAGEVTAKNTRGQSFSTSVSSTGMFALQLPQGQYALTGSSPQFGNDQYKCFALRTVTLFSRRVLHEDVYCSEK